MDTTEQVSLEISLEIPLEIDIPQTAKKTNDNESIITKVFGLYTKKKQLFLVLSNIYVEIYKVLMGTFLVFFVPQNCDGNTCELTENIFIGKKLYDASFIVNIIALFAFIGLYTTESLRESVLMRLKDGDAPNINIIVKANEKYIYSAIASFIIFIINSILSGVVIYQNNLGSKSATVYMTNILFLSTKLYNVYYVINSEKDLFYSAYVRDFIKYDFN
jgi:hypothetical protein